nr:hypothetical protein [uncultured Prevotella sp.]
MGEDGVKLGLEDGSALWIINPWLLVAKLRKLGTLFLAHFP